MKMKHCMKINIQLNIWHFWFTRICVCRMIEWMCLWIKFSSNTFYFKRGHFFPLRWCVCVSMQLLIILQYLPLRSNETGNIFIAIAYNLTYPLELGVGCGMYGPAVVISGSFVGAEM
jgi:hypothetical protein